MTPSSAATTKTTISVAFAPLALIAENAACPGVSKNVILAPVSIVIENAPRKIPCLKISTAKCN